MPKVFNPRKAGLLRTNLKARQRKDQSKMNKMEAAWFEILKSRGYDWLDYEPMGLKMADNCRYHPDFIALCDGQLVAFETKGFMRDDAHIKLKVAARTFPFIRFVLVTKVKGVWSEVDIDG